jgi:trehalose-phosphatase
VSGPATEAPLAGVPAELWRAATAAVHRLLILDYDGTLAPLRADRDAAAPLPGVVPLIERIAGDARTTVAIVTGRPLVDLDRLIAVARAHAVGEHGWERRAPGGPIDRHPLPEGCGPALAAAAGVAASRGWGDLLERKRAALMLHTRGLPAAQARAVADACRAAWAALAARVPLRLRPVDGGLELRAVGRDKGTAVRDLRAACPPGTVAVYIGDDDTDEDGFRALAGGGFGLRVARDDRPTAAQGRLRSCAEVRAFLERWTCLPRAGGGLPERASRGAPAGAPEGGVPAARGRTR